MHELFPKEPEPEARNLCTLNPKPETLNPEP
jgi:hypothetical protein